ncbi:MAG: family 16 glycoside hydrolase [Terracidiphilus sp.]|jgi:hypothetical protein
MNDWIPVKKLLLLFVLAAVSVPLLAQNKLNSTDVAKGWLNLYDGSSMFGWTSLSGWSSQDQMLTSPMANESHMVTALPFADFVLSFEYRLNATPSGAAVRIRGPRSDEPADSGYRIPLGDGKSEWPSGSIALRSKNTHPIPTLNAWHSVFIEADGARILVKIDGQKTAETIDDSAKSGYIHFNSTRGAKLDLRNIYIQPMHLNSLFNGVDLSGWKNIPLVSSHKWFGGKPHSASWSVRDGAIHGEIGPGALESTNTYDDFVLQLTGEARIDKDKEYRAFPAIYLRNDAGSIGTGYPLGFGRSTGEIRDLARPRNTIKTQSIMSQTVVAGGHVIGIFVNGSLETLFTDTRPDASSTKAGAKTTPGTISIDMPEDILTIDLRNISIESISHVFGGIVHAAPPPTPNIPEVAVAPSTAATTQQQQQQTVAAITAALGTPTPKDRQQVADFMSQALKSSDPNEQMQLYDKVIHIDPTNAAAVQGYKEAAAKVADQQLQAQQQQNKSQQQQISEGEREDQISNSLIAAQSYFLANNMKQADVTLRTAERLDPNNSTAHDLRLRISASQELHRRIMVLIATSAALLLLGVVTLYWRWHRMARFPILCVIHGLDQGRVYPLDGDVTRIGGIAQDSGQTNDIVIRDVEHLVSRFHCDIRKKDGSFFLVDNKSSNGTKIDGMAATPGSMVPIRKGAKIDLGGSTVLQFRFEKREKV